MHWILGMRRDLLPIEIIFGLDNVDNFRELQIIVNVQLFDNRLEDIPFLVKRQVSWKMHAEPNAAIESRIHAVFKVTSNQLGS